MKLFRVYTYPSAWKTAVTDFLTENEQREYYLYLQKKGIESAYGVAESTDLI